MNQKVTHDTSAHRWSDFASPEYWPTWIYLSLLFLLTRLPFSWQMGLGRALGIMFYKVAGKRRQICEINIRISFPDKSEEQQAELVKEVFVSYGKGLIETGLSWFYRTDYLLPRVSYEGKEHIDQAQSDGKGILLAGGHFATLDLSGLYVGAEYPVDAAQREHENLLFNHFMVTARERMMNGKCIARKDLRGMLKTLKRGGMLWYSPDQDFGRKNSVFVPFFDIPTATITGVSRLAKMTGCVVIPMQSIRKPDNSYVIRFHPPLDIPSGNDEFDATTYNQWLENCVKEFPEQYLWLHKRYKTRPGRDDKKFYPNKLKNR